MPNVFSKMVIHNFTFITDLDAHSLQTRLFLQETHHDHILDNNKKKEG
jgi:hypothetical protein